MKKQELVEIVIEYMAGGTCPTDLRGKYHPQVIEKYLELIYTDIVYTVNATANKQMDVSALDEYVKAFKDVVVHYDNEREEYYSILPASVISLPKNRGIRLISPMQEQGKKFWSTDNSSASVYDNLEVRTVLNKTKYYVEGNTIYYVNLPFGVKNVLMKLVVPFSEFDDEDEINISAQNSAQVFTMLIKLLMTRPFEHRATNGTSEQSK